MELTEKQITDFVVAWKKDFGETLKFETARAEALRLLDFFADLADAVASRASPTEDADSAELFTT